MKILVFLLPLAVAMNITDFYQITEVYGAYDAWYSGKKVSNRIVLTNTGNQPVFVLGMRAGTWFNDDTAEYQSWTEVSVETAKLHPKSFLVIEKFPHLWEFQCEKDASKNCKFESGWQLAILDVYGQVHVSQPIPTFSGRKGVVGANAFTESIKLIGGSFPGCFWLLCKTSQDKRIPLKVFNGGRDRADN